MEDLLKNKSKYLKSTRQKIFVSVDESAIDVDDFRFEGKTHPGFVIRLMTVDEMVYAQTLGEDDTDFKELVDQLLSDIILSKVGDWSLSLCNHIKNVNDLPAVELIGKMSFMDVALVLTDVLKLNNPTDEEKKS